MVFKTTKTTTYDPMSAYTPQQQEVVRALMSLASTGSGGGITLGGMYGGDLGNYEQTLGEKQSLAGLQGLVSSPEMIGATKVFSRMANNTFNPDDPSSGYAAFSRALAKSGKESQDMINQQAAITGGMFGSGRGRDTASLAADLANQRGSFLADLYNQSENRAVQGAAGLQELVGEKQNLYGQIQQQAEIERLLKDKQAKERYNEFNRSRSEELSRIGLMQDQWNNPMAPITKKGPSTLMSILGEVIPAVGSYNTHKYGYTTNQSSMSDAVQAAFRILLGAGG